MLSTRAFADITAVDASAAEAVPGVLSWVDRDNIPDGGTNNYGVTATDDEVMFADGRVHCYGQLVGLIVARDLSTAKDAAQLVKISYHDIPGAVLSIEDAIGAHSFLEPVDGKVAPLTLTHPCM